MAAATLGFAIAGLGRMGATLAVDPTKTKIVEVQKQLGMLEGFDVGLEMSGQPAADACGAAPNVPPGRADGPSTMVADATSTVTALINVPRKRMNYSLSAVN